MMEESERVTGIEPAPSAWKAEALPLSYTRTPSGCTILTACSPRSETLACVEASITGLLWIRRHGVWRSLVAHLLWEQGAVGSNPATPTSFVTGFVHPFSSHQLPIFRPRPGQPFEDSFTTRISSASTVTATVARSRILIEG